MQCVWAFFLNTSEGVRNLNEHAAMEDCVPQKLKNIIHMGL